MEPNIYIELECKIFFSAIFDSFHNPLSPQPLSNYSVNPLILVTGDNFDNSFTHKVQLESPHTSRVVVWFRAVQNRSEWDKLLFFSFYRMKIHPKLMKLDQIDQKKILFVKPKLHTYAKRRQIMLASCGSCNQYKNQID